jgi:hypothetical protein
MKVQNSLQSYYTNSFQGQSNSSADDDANSPFALPEDDGKQKTSSNALPSVASSGVPASLSSFWINQANDPTSTTGNGSSGGLSSQAIEDEFKNMADMTPAEKIRAQYLEDHNLTEDQFNQLPSDQQKAITDAIAQQIKQQLGDDSKNKQAAASGESDSAAAALSIV